ncbi:MAG: beta-galactosidase, partial [Phycisphaeraceae bacterium JB051]
MVFDLSTLDSASTGQTATHAWDLEPGSSAITIDASKPVTTLPVNLTLPQGSFGIGLWINAGKGTTVSFELSDGTKTITLVDGQLQGQAMAKRQSGMTTVYKNWTLRRAHWLEPSNNMVLKTITIQQSRPTGSLQLGGLLATVNGADPYRANRVWKLKDYVLPKPSSLNWTAIAYHEYGFGTDAVIRPAVFDDILNCPVTATLRVTLTDSFDRPIQTDWYQPHALKSGLTLPRLPKACYFLLIDRFNHAGHLLRSSRMVYQVLRDDALPVDLPMTEIENAHDPMWVDGYVADGPSGKVGQPCELTVHAQPIFKRLPKTDKLMLRWSVTDTTGMNWDYGRVAISRDQPAAQITVPSSRGGGYDLTLRWDEPSGAMVDQRVIRYGIEDTRPFEPPHAEDVSMRREQHRPMLMDMYSTHSDPSQYARLPQGSLVSRVAATYATGITPRLGVPWVDFEPVPGCYQWHIVERYLGYAQMSGKPVGIGLGFAGDSIPQWLWFEELMSQDQQTIHAGYHYVTPMGDRFAKALIRANEAFLKRYKNDWRLAGFHYYAGPSEGFLTDTPPDVSDYSPDARAKFQAYLADKYQQIENLNKAWQTQYESFDSIAIPQPNWDQPVETSRPWTDFHFFKVDFVSTRLDQLQSRARAIDPDHIMMMYGKEGFGPTGALAKVYRKNHFRYSNGGGETVMAYVQSSIMQSAGVDVQCEGHYVQPNLGSVTRTAANAILAGSYTGHNQMWGLVWAKKAHEKVPEYQAINQFNAAIAKVSDELNQLQLATPWAGYHAAHQDILTGRSFRMQGSQALMALQGLSTNVMHQPCAWVDDTSERAALSRYPLIVDTHSKVLT